MIPKVERKVMKLAELKPHPDNARERTMTPESKSGLRASLMTFGEVQTICWNKRSGFIVGGHERHEILVSEGVVEDMVSVVDLGPEDEAILRASLNNQAIAGRFTDVIGGVLEQLAGDRDKLLRELRLDALLPDDTESVMISHIPTGRLADRFSITITGEMPSQADVLQMLVKSLRDLGDIEVAIVTTKRG